MYYKVYIKITESFLFWLKSSALTYIRCKVCIIDPECFCFFFTAFFFFFKCFLSCAFVWVFGFFLRRENILYERLFGSHLTPCLWKHIDHVLALKCRVLPASLHLSDKQVGTLGPGSAVKNLLIGRWVIVCFVLFF